VVDVDDGRSRSAIRVIRRGSVSLAAGMTLALLAVPAGLAAPDAGAEPGGRGGAFRAVVGTGLGDVGPDDRMRWRLAAGWSTPLTGGVGLELLLGGQSGQNRQSDPEQGYRDFSFTALDMRADLLLGYGRSRRGLYAIAGVGVGLASVDLEEGTTVSDFDTDVTRWTGNTGTLVLDVGIGVSFVEHVEARLEAPIYLLPALEDRGQGEFISILLSLLYRI
jgi:hypothetical protein